jgi:hypothetical protein
MNLSVHQLETPTRPPSQAEIYTEVDKQGTSSPKEIQGHTNKKDSSGRLSDVLLPFRRELEEIAVSFAPRPSDLVLRKTVNRVMDMLAPRVITLGHSLGGIVNILALQQDRHDIAMAIGLGSPFHGVNVPPPAFNFIGRPVVKFLEPHLGKIVPAIPDITRGSAIIKAIQNNGIPIGTTAISVTTHGDALVPFRDALLPAHRFANMHNWPVRQSDGSLSVMVSASLQYLFSIPGGRQIGKLLDLSLLGRSINGHLSHVQDHEQKYSVHSGELTEQIIGELAGSHRLRRQLDPRNFEGHRENILRILALRLETGMTDPSHYHTRAFRETIEEAISFRLPFTDSSSVYAREVKCLIWPEETVIRFPDRQAAQ